MTSIASSGYVPPPTPALASTSGGLILSTAAKMAGGDPSAVGTYAEEVIKAHAQRIAALAADLDTIRAKLGDTWTAGVVSDHGDRALTSGVGQLTSHSDRAVNATDGISKGAGILDAIQTGFSAVAGAAEPVVSGLLSNPFTAAAGQAYGATTSGVVSTVTDMLGSLISKIASTALQAFITEMVGEGVRSLMADDPPAITTPTLTQPTLTPPTYTAPGYTALPGTTAPYGFPTGSPWATPGVGDGATPASYVPSSYPSAGYPSAGYPSVGYPSVGDASGLGSTWTGASLPGSTLPGTTGSLPPWLDGQQQRWGMEPTPHQSDVGHQQSGSGSHGGGGDGGRHDGGRHDGGRHDGGRHDGGRHDGGRHDGHQHGHHHQGHHQGDHQGDQGGRRGDDDGTSVTISSGQEQVTIHVDGDDPATVHTHLGGADGNDFDITIDPRTA